MTAQIGVALRMISGFRREVAKKCALLGCYATRSGIFLPTFRDNISVPFSGFKNKKSLLPQCGVYIGNSVGGCPETSVGNYH